tara:strand:- start:45648 stop:45989 length:342 start_codon:yes stop_codon:yes gene_type:complete
MGRICDRCENIIDWEDERRLGRGNCSCTPHDVHYLEYIFTLYARSEKEAIETFRYFLNRCSRTKDEVSIANFACGSEHDNVIKSEKYLPDISYIKERAVEGESWKVRLNEEFV